MPHKPRAQPHLLGGFVSHSPQHCSFPITVGMSLTVPTFPLLDLGKCRLAALTGNLAHFVAQRGFCTILRRLRRPDPKTATVDVLWGHLVWVAPATAGAVSNNGGYVTHQSGIHVQQRSRSSHPRNAP